MAFLHKSSHVPRRFVLRVAWGSVKAPFVASEVGVCRVPKSSIFEMVIFREVIIAVHQAVTLPLKNQYLSSSHKT